MTTDLHRCADCRFNPGIGWFCPRGNRHARGRTRLRCEGFEKPQPPPVRVPGHGFCVTTRRDTIGLVVEFVRPKPQ